MVTFLLLLAVPATAQTSPGPVMQAWAILKEGTADKSAARRAKATHSLGLIRDRQAAALAAAALNDSNKEVRTDAAISLGLMNARVATPKLRACLNDKEIQVVLACTNTLYLFKDPIAYEVYYDLLTQKRKSSKGLMQSQVDILHDRKQVEKLAFEAGVGFVPYGGMGWQMIRTIAHDDVSPVRALAAARLATDPDPNSPQALTGYLSDKKNRIREAVLEAIAVRGDPRLLNSVVELLDDENDSVRYDAAATVIELSRQHPALRPKKPSQQPAVSPGPPTTR